jgi:diguanylate cyclase (GGDEF)-like protein
MALINAVDIDAFALAILGFVYFNSRKRADRIHTQRRLFMAMVGALALLLVFDAAARMADGVPGGNFWNWATNIGLYLLVPCVPVLWLLYADFQVYRDEKRFRKLALPLGAYVLLNTALTLGSLAYGWFFAVDAANVYHRGPLVILHPMICYVFLIYTLVFIIRNRKRIDERHYVTMLVFPVPTAIGGILQCLFYGLALIWSGMALSILLIYFNIQDRRLDTDYLTGACSRRLLDDHLRERMQGGAPRKPFSAILIDLDNFKRINDTLGHDAGDGALADAVGLIKGCLRQGDFISRFGGDEFLVLLDIGDKSALTQTVRRIRESFRRFNETQSRPYVLGFSTGYAVYDEGCGMGPEQFISHLDRLMYAEKRRTGKKKQASKKLLPPSAEGHGL